MITPLDGLPARAPAWREPLPASMVGGLGWPALPAPQAQTMLATLFQLEYSQWWPAKVLAERQLAQLRELVAFSLAQVPHYRVVIARQMPELMADPHALTWEMFSRWPILTKQEMLAAGGALQPPGVPPEHGIQTVNYTSGSTGVPARHAVTLVAHFFRTALSLRSQLWHKLDFSRKFAVIRPGVSPETLPDWGAAPGVAYATGPCVVMSSSMGVAEQLDWLRAEEPGYVHSTASNLRALVLHSRRTGKQIKGVDAVLSYADTVPEDLRGLLRETWGARLIDLYSSTEAGVMALQCPEHEHFHIQSDLVHVEVLDPEGRLCRPGQIGRVVVTDLANFGMPLIRYEVGDYAQVGAPCPCGRGLPVLKRVMGRYRNMAVDPTGREFWPSFPGDMWLAAAPVRQVQLVQHTPASIEIRYVMDREMTADECAHLRGVLATKMMYAFDYSFTRVDSVTREAGGKYEDFISLCAPIPG